jgi:hypothetical protein
VTLTSEFSPTSTGPKHNKPPQIQRIGAAAPFSLRLSAAERERLTKEARGVPLGTYIKSKVLGEAIPLRMRRSGICVEDRHALARVLAALGSSRLTANLNQLARLAHIGALPLTPEVEEELAAVLRELREMRALLLEALGLKPEGAP